MVSQRLPSGRVTSSFSVSQEEFFDLLRNTPGVERVEWDTSKASQGNVGKHYMDQNVKFYVLVSPGTRIESVLTRNQRRKEQEGRPFTVTACFKDPPAQLYTHAWSILLGAVRGEGAHAAARPALLRPRIARGGL